MILINRLLVLTFFLLFIISSAYSQGLGNSPYSRYGVGDIIPNGTVRNQTIGGAGVGSPDIRFINFINPALLTYNKVVSFEGGLLYQRKNLETNTESQQSNGALPTYGVLSFPIHKKWTSAIGLRPNSIITFDRFYTETVEGDSTSALFVSEKGRGGTSTVFFGNGVKISDRFSIGAEASYGFGRREVESSFGLNGLAPITRNVLVRRENFNGFGFKLGGFYDIKLDSADKTRLGIGLNFLSGTNYNSKVFVSGQTQIGGISLTEDTFKVDRSKLSIPSQLTLGLSLKRVNRWTFSADMSYMPWSSYASNFVNPATFNTLSYKLGIEWIPNFRSVSSIFQRSIYRLGFYHEPYPFEVSGTRFNEFGMNIGLSLPVNKINFLSVGFGLGRRGTLENNLILENFARISFGLTINDPTWFRRFKLD